MDSSLRCWKCASQNVVLGKLRVGRVRTSAEQIQQGAEDQNTYQQFYVCECKYRWRPHEDRYLRMVVFHRARNLKIADLAVRFAKARQSCFVYVERVEHVELLGLLIKGVLPSVGLDSAKCEIVHGKMDDNEHTKEAFITKRVLVVVGNTVWGEGTNIQTLNWVINGSANGPGTALEQLIGRALRKTKGKYRAGFVDFKDTHDKVFAAKAKKRLDFFLSKGFSASVLSPSPSRTGRLKYRK